MVGALGSICVYLLHWLAEVQAVSQFMDSAGLHDFDCAANGHLFTKATRRDAAMGLSRHLLYGWLDTWLFNVGLPSRRGFQTGRKIPVAERRARGHCRRRHHNHAETVKPHLLVVLLCLGAAKSSQLMTPPTPRTLALPAVVLPPPSLNTNKHMTTYDWDNPNTSLVMDSVFYWGNDTNNWAGSTNRGLNQYINHVYWETNAYKWAGVRLFIPGTTNGSDYALIRNTNFMAITTTAQQSANTPRSNWQPIAVTLIMDPTNVTGFYSQTITTSNLWK